MSTWHFKNKHDGKQIRNSSQKPTDISICYVGYPVFRHGIPGKRHSTILAKHTRFLAQPLAPGRPGLPCPFPACICCAKKLRCLFPDMLCLFSAGPFPNSLICCAFSLVAWLCSSLFKWKKFVSNQIRAQSIGTIFSCLFLSMGLGMVHKCGDFSNLFSSFL